MSDRRHAAGSDALLDDAFYASDRARIDATLAELRSEGPMLWNDTAGCWFATSHAAVTEVSRSTDRFCSGRGIMLFEKGARYETPPTMMHTDPPAHTRYRALVQPGFRPGFVRSLEPLVRGRVTALVDRIVPGERVEAVDALSVPLSLQVIADLLGVPDTMLERFKLWSDAVIPGASELGPEERNELRAEMSAYLLDQALERRGADASDDDGGRSDIISELARVEIDGERLSDDEIVMFLVQLLVAGNETTRNMLSGGLHELAATPGAWERLRGAAAGRPIGDPAAPIPLCVEEMLRWTTPVVGFMRTATETTSVAGADVAPDEVVVMLYASANRDEAAFGPDAAGFDPLRQPNPHLSFGFGPHFCIGAALARLEARVLLDELLTRFGRVEPAGPVRMVPSPVIAGVTSAPLVFS